MMYNFPMDNQILWDLSSAGRASALQAEGHRFEPYRSHILCRSGGTGRRPGLKIPWVVIPVPVRFRSAALIRNRGNVVNPAFPLFFAIKNLITFELPHYEMPSFLKGKHINFHPIYIP